MYGVNQRLALAGALEAYRGPAIAAGARVSVKARHLQVGAAGAGVSVEVSYGRDVLFAARGSGEEVETQYNVASVGIALEAWHVSVHASTSLASYVSTLAGAELAVVLGGALRRMAVQEAVVSGAIALYGRAALDFAGMFWCWEDNRGGVHLAMEGRGFDDLCCVRNGKAVVDVQSVSMLIKIYSTWERTCVVEVLCMAAEEFFGGYAGSAVGELRKFLRYSRSVVVAKENGMSLSLNTLPHCDVA